jgi:hypothetical protein
MSKMFPEVHGKVRLTLTIDGTNYVIIPRGLSQFGDCPCFLLKKQDSKDAYTVAVTNQGVSCSCPDFKTRTRQDGACKHIKAMNVFYLLR